MNINRVYFAGNHTAEPEVNYSPKGTAVVSASIANNELCGGAGSGVGALATLCASLQVSIRYHDRDRYYHEGQYNRNNYRSDHPWIDVHV